MSWTGRIQTEMQRAWNLTKMDLNRSPSRFGSLRFSGMGAIASRRLQRVVLPNAVGDYAQSRYGPERYFFQEQAVASDSF